MSVYFIRVLAAVRRWVLQHDDFAVEQFDDVDDRKVTADVDLFFHGTAPGSSVGGTSEGTAAVGSGSEGLAAPFTAATSACPVCAAWAEFEGAR